MKTVRTAARGVGSWAGRLPRLLKAAPLLALLAVGGCAPDSAGAENAAQDFRQALADGDTSAACSMLTPHLHEEASAQGTCEEQLESLQLPASGEAMKAESYGRNAMVEFADDTVFLTVSGSGWQVTGAGCTAQGDAYNCDLGG